MLVAAWAWVDFSMAVQLILVFVLDKNLIIARYLQMSIVMTSLMMTSPTDSDWLMVKYSDWRRQDLYLVNHVMESN